MPTKIGRDLRPGDLLVNDNGQPERLAELRWTTGGLHYTTTVNAAAFPLDPEREYEVAHPMPAASMDWSVADQAWVVNIDTDGIPEGQHRVLVNLDGCFLNDGEH
jgi:hypothetical protein